MGKKSIPLLTLLTLRDGDRSKEELYARVLAGVYSIHGETIRDPRRLVDPDSAVDESVAHFVSRGGYKLEHALKTWNISIAGKVFLDAGASTGGFTHCLLKYGASRVHTVDVGYNQLDFSLRRDPRVSVHERTNIMHVERLDPRPDAAVADLSFRSITGAASHILRLTSEEWGIVLVKPQFEYTTGGSEFTGVLDDVSTIRSVVSGVIESLRQEQVFVDRIAESPISGRKGNSEFLFRISLNRTAGVSPMEQLDTALQRLFPPGRENG